MKNPSLEAHVANGQPKLTSRNEDRRLIEAQDQLYYQFRERLYKAVALKNRVLSDKSVLSDKFITGLPDESAMPDHDGGIGTTEVVGDTRLPDESAMPNDRRLTHITHTLNKLQCRLAGTAKSSTAMLSSEGMSSFVPSIDDLNQLDQCIIELTKIARTVTIADIDVPPVLKSPSKGFKWFKYVLWALAFVGLIAAIAGFVTAADGVLTIFEGDSLLAASLGLLGGVAYSFFNVLGILSSADYDVADWSKNIARLLLGVLLGWVFYFAFAQSAFASFANTKTGAATTGSIVILLPFLVGYSTALVVAILDTAMRAVFLALGLGVRGTSDTSP